MTYNEAETRFCLIDPVLRGKGYQEHLRLKLNISAPSRTYRCQGSAKKRLWTYLLLALHISVAGRERPVKSKKETTIDPWSYYRLWERFSTAITRVIVAGGHSHYPLTST